MQAEATLSQGEKKTNTVKSRGSDSMDKLTAQEGAKKGAALHFMTEETIEETKCLSESEEVGRQDMTREREGIREIERINFLGAAQTEREGSITDP